MTDQPVGLPIAETDGSTPDLYEGVDYARYWWGSARSRRDLLERAIIRRMLPARGRRLVDVGCGYGRLADEYRERFDQAIMLDGSLSLLRQARERTGGRCVYVCADLRRMPLRAATGDALLMVRVIQHLPDPAACLAELRRASCGGASLVLSYCNKVALATRVRWIGRSSEHPSHPSRRDTVRSFYGSPFYSHHPQTIEDLLKEAGFHPLRHLGAGKVEEVAAGLNRFDRQLHLGLLASRVLGRTRLSGWLFTQAVGEGDDPLICSESSIGWLECPACRGSIEEGGRGYFCPSCGRSYPVVDGIADFRLAEAKAEEGSQP